MNTSARDHLLFTPGPLTTSLSVKLAMLRDYGSRDRLFMERVADIRRRLLALAGADASAYAAIPMQGSGTFALEAVCASLLPPGGRLLVAVNGAYGRRVVQIARRLGLPVHSLDHAENEPVDPARIAAALRADPAIRLVSACHCETTSGILNPVAAIRSCAREAGVPFFLDAMSSFGGIPLDMPAAGVDILVSSSNKCIQGVPGFAFVLSRLDLLIAARGQARSLALDLWDQYETLEATGQFRFTPPVQVMAAFHQALLELEAEGGVPARHARFAACQRLLADGMRALGFRLFLPTALQSPIITSFHAPAGAGWAFEPFYAGLRDEGFVIYPGKVGKADCFRIGNIGAIGPADIRALLDAVRRVLAQLTIQPPIQERP